MMKLLTHEPLVYRSLPPRQPESPAPALVLLHGVGGNERNLLALAERLDPRLHVIAVRAPITLSADGYGWFEVRFAPDPIINPDQAEASRLGLIALLERLVIAHDLDPRRVFVAGFSQGAIMGASLALTRPDLVAGLAMLSGRVLPEIEPHLAPETQLGALHAFVAHGQRDAKLPVRHARATRDRLERLGVRLSYQEYDMAHEITPGEVEDLTRWFEARLRESRKDAA